LFREKIKTGLKDYKNGELARVKDELSAIVKSVTREAAEKTAAARDGLTKAAQIIGINENRRAEIEERSKAKPASDDNIVKINFKEYFDPTVWGEE
jgi:hypothetical protein